MTVGRPRIHHTPEELAEARKRARQKSREKTRNLTLDADLINALNAKADQMADGLGFRPSHSQVVRYLLRKASR